MLDDLLPRLRWTMWVKMDEEPPQEVIGSPLCVEAAELIEFLEKQIIELQRRLNK